MNKRSRSPELELRMNLNRSPVRPTASSIESVNIFSASSTSDMSSMENSCVSSEVEETHHVRYPSSPEIITTSMVLVGCPGCFMYVMLTDKNSGQCPKCKNNIFLDFFNPEN